MDKLALYSGLIAGGLGTGYNLYQGDSLPSALAQGAILGSTVGGGAYGAKLIGDGLLNQVDELGDIGELSKYRYHKPSNVQFEKDDYSKFYRHNGEVANLHEKAIAYKKQLDELNQLVTGTYNYVLPTGGLLFGMGINDLFQDKSEREKQQLLEELAMLQANGSVSPYIDDYLVQV